MGPSWVQCPCIIFVVRASGGGFLCPSRDAWAYTMYRVGLQVHLSCS